MPRSNVNLCKLSDDELDLLEHLISKAQDSRNDDSDGSLNTD